MASELSKLIEDQLQKHDEEAPLSPTEKQRLLSSSLRIKVPCPSISAGNLCLHQTPPYYAFLIPGSSKGIACAARVATQT